MGCAGLLAFHSKCIYECCQARELDKSSNKRIKRPKWRARDNPQGVEVLSCFFIRRL